LSAAIALLAFADLNFRCGRHQEKIFTRAGDMYTRLLESRDSCRRVSEGKTHRPIISDNSLTGQTRSSNRLTSGGRAPLGRSRYT